MRVRPALSAAALAAALTGCAASLAVDPPGAGARAPILGADLSHLPRLESLGAIYRVDGRPVRPLDALRERGFGLVRVRLWHTPETPWQGLDSTVAFARAAARAGHAIMLDLHYSDTWADPAHQRVPAAWRGLAFEALVDSVRAYTGAVVRRFDEAGATPAYVQLGNEILGGLLWDAGRVGGAHDTPAQWRRLAALLAAGAEAVREGRPSGRRPRVVLHVDQGADNGACRWFFDRLVREGVAFDAIGLSYYPWWHGTLGALEANLHDLARRYGREILIVETAYPWTLAAGDAVGNFVDSPDDLHPGYPASPAGQAAFLARLRAIVADVPGGLGRAVVYWEPLFVPVRGGPENPCENLALFDYAGEALPALDVARAPGR